MKKCECGNKWADDLWFCGVCGKSLPAAPVSDARPLLAPESVDAIPDGVCKAVWRSFAPPVDLESVDDLEYEVADMGREMIRAVAAYCRVPMPQLSGNPGALDTDARKERFRARECASASGSYWAAEDTETGIVAAGFSNESQAAHAALAMQASYDRGRIEASPQPLDTAEADAALAEIIDLFPKNTAEMSPRSKEILHYIHLLKGKLVLPQPIDTAEADRIINDAIRNLECCDAPESCLSDLRSLRGRLTLKPRRLTDDEASDLAQVCERFLDTDDMHHVPGHAIAAEVARLWGLEVPEERPYQPAPAITAAEADAVIGAAINSLRKDTREGYGLAYAHMCSLRSRLTLKPRRLTDAEALELSEFADSRVPAEAVAGHSIAREVARLWRMEVPEERPAECDHRILAARKAKDVADMQPPFEGPKHGFAVPDEANANVNGLTGEGAVP